MHTWRIERTPDGHVSWIAVAGDLRNNRRTPAPKPADLPELSLGSSMDDLLREVLPKILEENCASEPAEMQEINKEKETEQALFRTGSGKPVPISDSSINKAKAILESNTEEQIGHGGNQNQIPIFQTGAGRPVSIDQNCIKRARAILEIDPSEGLIGNGGNQIPIFQTGSGRPVSLDQNCIKKARAILEIDPNEEQIPIFQTGSGRPVSVNHSSIHKARTVLENHISDEEQIPVIQNGSNGSYRSVLEIYNNEEGFGNQSSIHTAQIVLENEKFNGDTPIFETGLGGPVSVSDNSMQKARAILNNGKNEENCGDIPIFQIGSGRPVSVCERLLQKARAILENNKKEERCEEIPMFATGSGRPVSLSENSIKKAKAILENGNNDEGFGDIPLFKSGSGQPVLVNQSSIHTARAILENEKNEERCEDIPIFPTGSGRPVSVSENSIQKARALLENDKNVNEGNGDLPVFETGSGRPVSICEDSIQKARAILENGQNEEKYGDIPMFQTGSGRPVSVCERLLQKARAILENGKNGYEDIPIFETGSGRPVSVSENSIQKARAILENNKNEEIREDIPQLFETGSGRPVSIGKDSIEKARAILENGKNEEMCGDFPMFQTGSGRPVSVCERLLQKARAILENGKNEQGYEDMPMFESGSGRPVSVSENSLQKARAILENDKNGGAEMQMFQTGLGRPVPISESSIEKAKRILEAGNVTKDTINGDCGAQMPLFQTGLGRPVLISETSINKARAVLQAGNEELEGQINTKQNHNLSNLQKGPSNPAKFSSSNISRATTLLGLDDTDLSATQILNHAKNIKNDSNNNNFISPLNNLHQYPCEALQGLSTASGRPISVSNDALNRAKSLLGNPNFENETIKREEMKDLHVIKANPNLIKDLHAINGNDNLMKDLRAIKGNPYLMKDLHVMKGNNNVISTSGSSVELNNQIGKGNNNNNNIFGAKKRAGKISTVSPFKKPRSSRFITPLNNSTSFIPPGPSSLTKLQNGCQKIRVSTRYPFQHKRKTLEEFFGLIPSSKDLEDLPDKIKQIDSDAAEKFVFKNERKNLGFDFDCVGSDEIRVLLIQSGATSSHATKEWVSNHYKWIVWKLACYERFYPIPFGKYLTVSNVLEELKYRYEREINFGHRSAIKKILDGDASPSFMMILCISKIISSKTNNSNSNSNDDSILKQGTSPTAKIVLTDGWYSLEASLDVLLTKKISAKKIFVGQKIRIWGASLCGWVGPISFLEANGAISLSLHINGTYRASWHEPLGFCKKIGPPLAFKCIKSSGGIIPLTLVGIKRVYPLLYKERLSNGGSVVRSERMERDAGQLYLQRRSNIAEDIISKQQEICSNSNSNEFCEGAKISKLIEKSAEPELLMAGFTSEQLNTLSSYQTKQKEIRQGEMGKKIEKALEKAGLGARDVSPFMKLRIVGLNCKNSSKKSRNKEGLVTIWNPNDKHKMELLEGKMYKVMGLVPSNFGGEILYLQARGSSTIWRPLHSLQSDYFEPFFTPRKAVRLCNLGEVPLASEFDIAGVILFVGDMYISDQQKRQWIFISDGSKFEETELEENCFDDSILAINFFSPIINDDDSSLKLFNHTLQGSTVGFLNLIKRARDQNENIWIAEATEYSIYSLSFNSHNISHLKEAATSAEKWAKTSPSSIKMLRERVSCLINCQGK